MAVSHMAYFGVRFFVFLCASLWLNPACLSACFFVVSHMAYFGVRFFVFLCVSLCFFVVKSCVSFGVLGVFLP